MAAFIVFEGCDGAGLSTQASNLYEYLIKRGKVVLLTKEPTSGIIGGMIRAALRKEWQVDHFALQMLYAADRCRHETEIEQSLKKGRSVICDRYILSSLVYGSVSGVPLQLLKQINSTFRRPDLTFLLDVHPRIALERIKHARSHTELFETEQQLSAVRQAYLSLKNTFTGTVVIDSNRPVEQVWNDIKLVVNKKI